MLMGSFRFVLFCNSALGILASKTWMQGSLCVCVQPMRDDVAMQHRLSLIGRIHKMIPVGCTHFLSLVFSSVSFTGIGSTSEVIRGTTGKPWLKSGTSVHSRLNYHYDDVTMSAMAFQITSLTIVYSTVYSDPDQRKHQSSASLAFVRGSHRWPAKSPHNGPVTQKMLPLDDDGFPSQRARNAECVSMSWRHHDWVGWGNDDCGVVFACYFAVIAWKQSIQPALHVTWPDNTILKKIHRNISTRHHKNLCELKAFSETCKQRLC